MVCFSAACAVFFSHMTGNITSLWSAQPQVGAEFLALHYPLKLIYIPSPTWANHNKIFPLAGIQIRNYRYYKPSTRGLDFEVIVSCC